MIDIGLIVGEYLNLIHNNSNGRCVNLPGC
jgi:hypothetical protein